MKILVGIFLSFCIGFPVFGQPLSVGNLRCGLRSNPIGIDSPAPGLSWELQSSEKNVVQVAYRVLVSDDPAILDRNIADTWDSKKVLSAATVHISYGGRNLQAGKRYYWKIMAWDNKGNVSAWSETAYWQMGLLSVADWNGARWIAWDTLNESQKIIPAEHGNGKKEWGSRRNILPMFRKEFNIARPVKRATAFATGLGQFEMRINGKKAGDHFLDPGWTKFDKTALYVSFDLTDQLRKGRNVIGMMLGNGFYYLPGERYRKMTGAYDQPKMILRLLVEYADGGSENVISDGTWKVAPSPLRFSSIYGGEDYDATAEQNGWDEPGFDDGGWRSPIVCRGHPLRSQVAEPVRIMNSFLPVKSVRPGPSRWVYDFGQNMSGIPSITVRGNRGDTVIITPAELLNEDGLANQRSTGSPSYFRYILKGDAEESWRPRFTYYGFRYVQVDLKPNAVAAPAKLPEIVEVKALHTRNSMARIGAFDCSNQLFKRTFDLILWAINSNTQSIFTDCPHRERLGWLEQVHLMGNSIQYNYDIAALSQKILGDIQDAQAPSGFVSSTVPEYTEMHFANGYFRDSPEWGSSAVIYPWYLYQWYGDRQFLADHYSSMSRYADYLGSRDSSYLLMYGLSDWYDLGPGRPGFCQLTPMGLTATAYYYYDLIILEKTAALLGKQADAVKYAAWARKVRNAFNKAFFNANTKQYGSGSQTSNAIAIYMGLVREADRQAVIQNIIEDLRNRNYSLSSGDIGFRYLLKVLDDAGRNDLIFSMNNRSDVPGYGYQLEKGATALTESWQASAAVSNNHLMLGHLMEWFYEGLCGIRQAKGSVGYKKIEIRPQPVGEITHASGAYHSVHGLIRSEWTREGDEFRLVVTIPPNTTAEIYLPGAAKPVKVGSGNYSFKTSLK